MPRLTPAARSWAGRPGAASPRGRRGEPRSRGSGGRRRSGRRPSSRSRASCVFPGAGCSLPGPGKSRRGGLPGAAPRPPSRTQGGGRLGIPHPPPAPPRRDPPPASRLRGPGFSGCWAGPRVYTRSAKTRWANPAAGADTWSRGALCCWRRMEAPGKLFKEKPDSLLAAAWPGSKQPLSPKGFL